MKYFYSFILVLFLIAFSNAQTVDTFNTPGSNTFTVPAGVTQITVETWGAGGRGGSTSKSGGNATVTAAGGGGGAYSIQTISVTPNQIISYTVGAGSTTTAAGGTSSATALSSIFVSASGGSSVPDNGTTGAIGGLVTVGSVSFVGGNGANSAGINSGGGGSSAGTNANGNNAVGLTGGQAPINGGAGANGVSIPNNTTINGIAGQIPGGGGGGSAVRGGGTLTATGGAGANGRVRFTYDDGCTVLTSQFTVVDAVQSSFTNVPQVTAPSGFLFGVGTENKRNLVSFEVGALDFAIDRLADRIVLRRAGTSGQVAGINRDLLFFEQTAAYEANAALNPKEFRNDFFATMEEGLVGVGINRGADNVFNNITTPNNNNIERLDYIFEDGLVVPNDPNIAGFPIFERGGNDSFKFAVISELDINADPSAYSTVISYASADWTDTAFDVKSSVLSRNGGNFTETANLTSQNIEVIFVSFADMGLSAGDVIYGYSLGGSDATTNCVNFLSFNNTSFFPQTTNSTAGGLDLLSGGSFSKVSYIYTDAGWSGEDPNIIPPTCDDNLTVVSGIAPLDNDMTFGTLSAIRGSIDLATNTLSICADINVESGFNIIEGTVDMIGTAGTQFIRGSDKLTVDDLSLNNSDGLNVDTELDITGTLNIQDGQFSANAITTFRCGFDVVGSLAVKTRTAQINEVLGSVVSNNNFVTEQCYPGRRAFRLVSPSATTTRSIRATWQESANAWDNNPVPGYGTHITGLGVQNETIGANDGQNGFDWQPSGNPSLFVLSNTNIGNWTPINNTDVNTLVAGSPYRLMIRGSRAVNLVTNQSATSNTILRETGNLAVGDVDFSFSGLAENTPILIGNPYQANVDLVALLANSSGIKVNAVAVWYPRLGGLDNINNTSDPSLIGGRGGFISFNPSDVAATTVTYNGQSAGGIDSAPQVNNLLQPMQSVYVLADGSATVEIRFRENQKLVSGTQTQAFSIDDSFKFSLLLFDENSFNEGDTMKDGIVINFSENGQNEMDENDLSKFVNDDENLARIYTAANTLLSVEQRELPVHGETLPLFVNKYRTSDYTFVANLENLPGQTNAFLKDSYTEIMYPLNEGENFINFSVEANTAGSLANNRFEIVFENTTLSNVDFETANIQVYPNPASDVIHISTDSNVTFLEYIELFDLNGRLVKREDVSDKKEVITLNINTVTSGIYILKVNTKDTQFSRKVIIK